MTPVEATTAVALTLTCNIGDVIKDVIVTWKDQDDQFLTSGQGGYTIDMGSVDSSSKLQKSTLEITSTTLAALGDTTVTFKCAAQSKQYPHSKISDDKDIVLNFLTFGEPLIIE